jgi:DNA (cytosine-5)-methyltransferase 1
MAAQPYAYYNENNKFAAAWLRKLMAKDLIMPGDVDERSITEVDPSDLTGYTQCHFFAGIGGWSYALRLANWPDDRPVWTSSPPCQPFSAAGKRNGKSDERHLWPKLFNLIRQCQPATVFGEQVASAIRYDWFDDLQTDLEGEGYATGMVVLPACSVGAPHKRDRLYFVGHTTGERCQQQRKAQTATLQRQCAQRDRKQKGPSKIGELPGRSERLGGYFGTLGDTNSNGCKQGREATTGTRQGGSLDSAGGADSIMADTNSGLAHAYGKQYPNRIQGHKQAESLSGKRRSGETTGLWGPSFWERHVPIYCNDGNVRVIPVESEIFPLAHGFPNRVGALRGAGNAIVPQVAAEVIKAFMDWMESPFS